jgi:phosphoglycolate phosphatase-like HAD superfamily hydrolase
MKDVIIIDLDGTLCDDRHRDHLAKAEQWEEFHSLLHLDEPFPDIVSLLRMTDQQHIVLAVTARNEMWRALTYSWFAKHSLMPYIDGLLMRPDDNYEPSEKVKIDLIEEWFREAHSEEDLFDPALTLQQYVQSRVMFCLDDREKIIDAFRAYGLPCWQVRAGVY